MTSRRASFQSWAPLLLAAASCHGARRGEAVRAPAVVAPTPDVVVAVAPDVFAAMPWPSRPSPAVRSCPAPDGAAPVAVAFDPRESLGEVAGVTRVLGVTREGAWRETSLDRAGALTLAATAAVPREQQGRGLGHDLDDAAPTDPFDSGYETGELYRWHCAAGWSGLSLDGDGPTRRLHVTAAGGTTPALVADEHTLLVSAVRVGERALVLWTSAGSPGVRARPYGPDGRPAGAAFGFAAEVAFVRGLHVWRAPHGSFVAWKDNANAWRAAPIAPGATAVGDAQALALPADAFSLTSAVLPNGALFGGFTNSVSYDGGRHAWSGVIHALFVPDARDATPEAARQVARGGGPGRGELRPFLMVNGSRAAALVASRDGWGGDATTLVTLRVPCAP